MISKNYIYFFYCQILSIIKGELFFQNPNVTFKIENALFGLIYSTVHNSVEFQNSSIFYIKTILLHCMCPRFFSMYLFSSFFFLQLWIYCRPFYEKGIRSVFKILLLIVRILKIFFLDQIINWKKLKFYVWGTNF